MGGLPTLYVETVPNLQKNVREGGQSRDTHSLHPERPVVNIGLHLRHHLLSLSELQE